MLGIVKRNQNHTLKADNKINSIQSRVGSIEGLQTMCLQEKRSLQYFMYMKNRNMLVHGILYETPRIACLELQRGQVSKLIVRRETHKKIGRQGFAQ